MPRDAGVTLIEVLVVLALIAVLAGSVSLGLGALTRDDRVARAAELLAARLQTVADAAVQSGTDALLVWDDRAYGFAVPGPDGWTPAATAFPPREALPGGIRLSPGGFGQTRLIRADALPGGEPLALVLADGAAEATVIFDGLTATAMQGGPQR